MPDGLTTDLLRRSVTSADQAEYKGGGVVSFLIPWFMMGAANLPLPADLPPYWTLNLGIARYWSRDMILRSTILHEDFWASAVFKAATKQASKSFEVKGRGADRWQQIFLDWGGDGYVPSQERAIIDFLSTNNGAFWEVVRVSNATGSRILGLVHLDSLRCIRTGDPEIPIVFCDLKGKYHELRTHQVLTLVDMPDPSAASLGIGHCAAERAYHHIYELSAIRQYVREKVTGSGANVIDFISGLNSQQLSGIVDSAKMEQQGRGMTYYQGHILTGLLGQTEPKLLQIKLRDLPDGFVATEELNTALLVYANAIGLDPQDIDPKLLGPRSMGVSAQSAVLDEKQHALGLAAYDKQTTHLLNNWVLPTSVTFAFNERDLRNEQIEAAVALAREQMRNSMILNGQLTAQQGLQMAIEDNNVPRDFLPAPISNEDTPLSDEEKPLTEAAPTEQPQAVSQTAQPTAKPAPGQGLRKDSSAQVKEMKSFLKFARVAAKEERWDAIDRFVFNHTDPEAQKELRRMVWIDEVKRRDEIAVKELAHEIRLARIALQRQNGNGNQPTA